MTKTIRTAFLISGIVLLSASLNVLSAQPSGPPTGGPNGGHDLGGNKGNEGGGAPVDGGLIVLLAMVAAFGAWKWVNGELKRKQSGQEL